jgi:hypothetical protein
MHVFNCRCVTNSSGFVAASIWAIFFSPGASSGPLFLLVRRALLGFWSGAFVSSPVLSPA